MFFMYSVQKLSVCETTLMEIKYTKIGINNLNFNR